MMPRPKRCRRIHCDIGSGFFKPRGIPMRDLEIIELELDELEAIRLSDLMGMKQSDASKKMDVSQPTFNRILSSGRRKVARALIKGQAIKTGPGGANVSIESSEDEVCIGKHGMGWRRRRRGVLTHENMYTDTE